MVTFPVIIIIIIIIIIFIVIIIKYYYCYYYYYYYYYCYICMEEKITQKQLKKVQNLNKKQTKKRNAIETVRGYKFRSIEWHPYQSYRQ